MFRTELQTSPLPFQLGYNSKIITMGSCFANAIGQRLDALKFQCSVNPYGTLFNPISIFDLIELTATTKSIHPNLFTEIDGYSYHFSLHSHLHAANKEALKTVVDQKFYNTKLLLDTSDVIILTFGTAFVHRHAQENTIVANCHKADSRLFQKELLTQKQILTSFENIYPLLPKKANIILTVSPVRHTREGLSENSESKAILRTTCGTLERTYSNVHYFPAYEIQMDDLRDYRFYQSDMIHPSEAAEDYIFQKFIEVSMNKESQRLALEVGKINKALAHRPFRENSSAHKKFVKETIRKMKELSNKIDFSKEITQAESNLMD